MLRRPDVLPRPGVPVVCAPMAGGPTTVDLVAEVTAAGGLAFLAAGYRTGAQVAADVDALRARTDRPFGVNVFLPGAPTSDLAAVRAYAARLASTAARLGVALGEPRWDDDDLDATLTAVAGVPVVSTAFGCPAPALVERLHVAGSAVVVTVGSVAEAREAERAGVDGLVVQGDEAGGQRGGAHDFGSVPPLGELLPAVRAAVGLPLWAAGGLMTGADVAGVLRLGADAGVLGTAFLGCPEAGTSATHRAALADHRFDRTVVTRAFTGRSGRGLANAFAREHEASAPAAFPEVHAVTRPLRVEAARRGEPDLVHLWAGTGWRRMRPLPAAELVRTLADEGAAA